MRTQFTITILVTLASALSGIMTIYWLIPFFEVQLALAKQGSLHAFFSTFVYIGVIIALLTRIFFTNITYSKPSKVPLYPLVVFIFCGTAINMYSTNNTIQWAFVYISMPILYILITNHTNTNLTEILFVCTIYFGCVMAIIMTFSDATGNFPSLKGVIESRSTTYFLGKRVGPVVLATISGVSLVGAFALWYTSPTRWVATTILFSFPLSMTGLLASGGRMALLVSTLMITLILVSKLRIERSYAWKLVGLVFIGTIVVSVVLTMTNILNEHSITRIQALWSENRNWLDDRSGDTRTYQWQNSLALALRYPMGIGFDYYTTRFGYSPHNELIQQTLSAGIIGMSAFVIFSITALYQCYLGIVHSKSSVNTSIATAAFTSTLFMLLVGITEAWSISNTFATLIFWTLISIGVNTNSKLNRTSTQSLWAPQSGRVLPQLRTHTNRALHL